MEVLETVPGTLDCGRSSHMLRALLRLELLNSTQTKIIKNSNVVSFKASLFSRSSRLRPKMFPCLFILVLMRFQYFQCALDIQLLVSVNKAESSRTHFASGSLNFDNIR